MDRFGVEEEQDDEEEDLVAPGSEPEPKSKACIVVHILIFSFSHVKDSISIKH